METASARLGAAACRVAGADPACEALGAAPAVRPDFVVRSVPPSSVRPGAPHDHDRTWKLSLQERALRDRTALRRISLLSLQPLPHGDRKRACGERVRAAPAVPVALP